MAGARLVVIDGRGAAVWRWVVLGHGGCSAGLGRWAGRTACSCQRRRRSLLGFDVSGQRACMLDLSRRLAEQPPYRGRGGMMPHHARHHFRRGDDECGEGEFHDLDEPLTANEARCYKAGVEIPQKIARLVYSPAAPPHSPCRPVINHHHPPHHDHQARHLHLRRQQGTAATGTLLPRELVLAYHSFACSFPPHDTRHDR